MANRFRSDPAKVWTQYQQFEGFGLAAKDNGFNRIIEVEANGGVRLLAGISPPNVYLLDMGPHDIEQQWDRIKTKTQWVQNRKANAEPAGNLLSEGSANPFIPLSEYIGHPPIFPGEDTSEWVTFLDTQQYEVTTSIIREIEDHYWGDRKSDSFWLILGGPGTGKTVVLLKILQKMLCAGADVGFSCSDAVYRNLKSTTGWVIPRYNPGTNYDVLLFDDPSSLEILTEQHPKPEQKPRALVYAFDPLQLSQMPTSSELSGVIERTKAREYPLSICYR